MRRFAALYEAIDRTTSTNEKVAAMAAFFRSGPAASNAWALYLLTGGKLKRVVNGPTLARWASEIAGIPDWLFRESYTAVGDLAETIALVCDAIATPREDATPIEEWIEGRLEPLRHADTAEQRERVVEWLTTLGRTERFLLVKILTGELRVGVSRTLVVRAAAEAFDLPAATVAHRVMGTWRPTAEFFVSLGAPETGETDRLRPYPFYLASPIEDLAGSGGDVSALGPIEEWQLEWKWDGIRAQLIRRASPSGPAVSLWSRGDEHLTDRFPDIIEACARLPDGVVLDGEVLCWTGGQGGSPLPFSKLQRRIGRQEITRRVLAEAPAAFMAYDLLEAGGEDIRNRPLAERRAMLERVAEQAGSPRLLISPLVHVAGWEEAASERERSRELGVEGLMIKRRSSPYQSGRVRGDWWKWKIDPYAIDAVLVHAEPGHGRRASLLTDYTFAVRDGADLVPFAKAYSGLTDEEILELDRWIRRHTTGRHGPVRVVEPVQVFEIAFEGIARSDRHRSGVAVRFPRMARWRKDKPAAEADSIDTLRRLLPAEPDGGQGMLFDMTE